ncbi:MAG: hypothetical protein MJZ26_03695 [Fibrobacter sp.]|nr:hypothetical protein [Fibrobacter sp.]
MNNALKATLFAGIAGFVGAQAATQYGGISIEEVDGKVVATIDGESTETIDIPEDVVVDEVVYVRKGAPGYVPEDHNAAGQAIQTIVVPFTSPFGCFSGFQLFRVVDIKKDWDGGPWKAYAQQNVDPLEANTPYIMVPHDEKLVLKKNDSQCSSKQVTFNTSEGIKKVAFGNWEFHGTYEYKKWAEGDPDLGCIFGFAGKNRPDINVTEGQFVKGKAGASIKPLRAYLYYNKNATAGAKRTALASNEIASIEELPSSIDVEFLNEEGKPMAIGRMNTSTGAVTMQDRWFDLKGRMLDHKPTVKGTYYHMGQKVIVK